MFPKLAGIACHIMCMPACSAPVERVFYVSGEANWGINIIIIISHIKNFYFNISNTKFYN